MSASSTSDQRSEADTRRHRPSRGNRWGALTQTATAPGPALAMSPEPSLATTSRVAAGAAHAGVAAHTSERVTRVNLTERQRSQHAPERTPDEEGMLEGGANPGELCRLNRCDCGEKVRSGGIGLPQIGRNRRFGVVQK